MVFRNNKGISLVETLVAAGMVGILAIGSASIITYVQKEVAIFNLLAKGEYL